MHDSTLICEPPLKQLTTSITPNEFIMCGKNRQYVTFAELEPADIIYIPAKQKRTQQIKSTKTTVYWSHYHIMQFVLHCFITYVTLYLSMAYRNEICENFTHVLQKYVICILLYGFSSQNDNFSSAGPGR